MGKPPFDRHEGLDRRTVIRGVIAGSAIGTFSPRVWASPARSVLSGASPSITGTVGVLVTPQAPCVPLFTITYVGGAPCAGTSSYCFSGIHISCNPLCIPAGDYPFRLTRNGAVCPLGPAIVFNIAAMSDCKVTALNVYTVQINNLALLGANESYTLTVTTNACCCRCV